MTLKESETSREGHGHYSLDGRINENTKFDMIEKSSAKTVIIDMDNVTFANSIGLRNITETITKLIRQDKCVVFVNVPVAFMKNIFPLQNFRDVTIASLYVPFYCENCDVEFNELINYHDIEKYINNEDEYPECYKCNERMEFDDVPELYFMDN